MESILPPLVLLLIALAAFQLAQAGSCLRSGLPAGELVEDTGAGSLTRPLRNARIGLPENPIMWSGAEGIYPH